MDRWAALDDAGARARAAAGLPAETLRRLEDLRTTHQILAIQRVPPWHEPDVMLAPFVCTSGSCRTADFAVTAPLATAGPAQRKGPLLGGV